MITQQHQLSEELSNNGWAIVAREITNPEWWADEIWMVESKWSPKGFRIYLTFEVDPWWDGNRKKGEHVWSIAASKKRPTGQGEDVEASISLKTKWEKRLEGFIDELDRLRNAA